MKHTSFFRNLLGDDFSVVEKIVKKFNESQHYELEFSVQNLPYPEYLRSIKKYVTEGHTPEYSQTLTTTLDQYRVTLDTPEKIEEFLGQCNEDTDLQLSQYLNGLPEETIIILKKRDEAQKVFLHDISALIKLTEETPAKSRNKIVITPQTKKFYRYRQRMTFHLEGWDLEFTEIKESHRLKNLMKLYSTYEVELESTGGAKLDSLFENAYHLICILQDNDTPILHSESKIIVEKIFELLGSHNKNIIQRKSFNLTKKMVDHIPNKYAVTDKKDGERFLMYLQGEQMYLISSIFRVLKKIPVKIPAACNHTLLDGELVSVGEKKIFFLFDVIYYQNIDFRFDNNYSLKSRISAIEKILTDVFQSSIPFPYYDKKNGEMELYLIKKYYEKELEKYWNLVKKKLEKENFLVISTLYFIPYGIDKCEIYFYSDLLWKSYVFKKIIPYTIDGLVYTPVDTSYLPQSGGKDNLLEYKWKPNRLNSIDFYIRFETDEHGEDLIFRDSTMTAEEKDYKICHLYVGLRNGPKEIPVPFKIGGQIQKTAVFLENQAAKDLSGFPLENQSVVEFIYDESAKDPLLKWIPLKTRYDKTNFVRVYHEKYGNYISIANRIWDSIINAITEKDFSLLAEPESYAAFLKNIGEKKKSYYQMISSDSLPMKKFHNFIKTNMIAAYTPHGSKVLDFGCGRGGDSMKFVKCQISEYTGVDVDYQTLFVIGDSALSRWSKIKKGKIPYHLIQADLRALLNYPAQSAIFPQMKKENRISLENNLSGVKKYNVINCQFNIHYYLSDSQSWKNFMQNINDHLEPGGYFLVSCFDGKLLSEKLEGKKKLSYIYSDANGDGKLFFEIVKNYDDSHLSQKLGLLINVYNSMINVGKTYYPEYLVFPDFLEKSLEKNCDLQLVETDSFKNLFDLYEGLFIMDPSKIHFDSRQHCGIGEDQYRHIQDFYFMLNEKYGKSYQVEARENTQASYQVSILNRYYVFQKRITDHPPSHVIGVNHKIKSGQKSDSLKKILEEYHLFINPYQEFKKRGELIHMLQGKMEKKPDVHIISLGGEGQPTIEKRENSGGGYFLIYHATPFYYPIYRLENKKRKYLLDGEKLLEKLYQKLK